MKRLPPWAWIAAVAVAALVVVLLLAHHGKGDADQEPEATASVTLAPVKSQTLATVVRAYGVVQPAPDAAVTVAAPRAAVVMRLLVAAGQPVRAGQPLIELANAPAAEQAYRQAEAAASFAERDLERAQRLFGERLASADQVSAAEKTLADARAALAAQTAEGAGAPRQTVLAPAEAVVTALAVKPGDRVAQDSALLTLARSGALVAALNVQADAAGVAPGEPVVITSAFGGARVSSRLSMVGKVSDPATRTLQALAPAPSGAFPVGEAVRAEITIGRHAGLTVPRAAVVFDETGTHLFTVSNGKAHRVFVTAGADHGQDIEVKGPLAAGSLVAVQGAYELQDGMSVRAAGR